MNLEDIEVGQEVICTKLRADKPNIGYTSFRGVGHIGSVISIFPIQQVAFIGHIEKTEDEYVEHLTSYFIDEIELFNPPERKLKDAIIALQDVLD